MSNRGIGRRLFVILGLAVLLSTNLYAAPRRGPDETFFRRALKAVAGFVKALGDTVTVPDPKP